MKLQLWTDVDGQPDELLGEVDVTDEEWADCQSSGADSLQLIRDLTDEIGGVL